MGTRTGMQAAQMVTVASCARAKMAVQSLVKTINKILTKEDVVKSKNVVL